MKFLLIVLAFIITPDGNLQQVAEPVMIEAASLDECNQLGRNFRSYVKLDDSIKTISICVRDQ